MIGIEHVWAAVSFAVGTCFGTACMVASMLWEEHISNVTYERTIRQVQEDLHRLR